LLIQLAARDFRNLEPLDLAFGEGIHLVLGPNGAGKTSLLEAIYALATTRSFRTARIADCRRHGAPGFRLRGEVDAASRTTLDFVWLDGGRDRLVNGKSSTLAAHLEVLPVVAWSAGDLDVLVGSPAERRRFLDRGVVGQRPAAIAVLGRYRRVLEEKRRLIERGGADAEWQTWNHMLAAAAAELIGRRAAYARELASALDEVLGACALGFPPIELRYQPSPRRGPEGAESIYDELAAAAAAERRQQRLLLGPHRDELRILWGGRELRQVASAGERKALGLALVTAHGEVLRRAGRAPSYLLDDVDTELDRSRLEALWGVLGAARQLFATSNRPRVWESIATSRRWQCEAGRIVQAV